MNWMQKFWHVHDKWYWERYFHHCGQTKTYKAAWERTEQEVYDRFEVCRFSDYESFKNSKQRKFSPKSKYKFQKVAERFIVGPVKDKKKGQMKLFDS